MKAIHSTSLLLLVVIGCGHAHKATSIPGMHGLEGEILHTEELSASTTIRTLDTLDGYDFERIDRVLKALGGFDPNRCDRWGEDIEFFDGDRNIDCIGTITNRRAEVSMIMQKERPASTTVIIHLSFRDGDTSRSTLAGMLANNLAGSMTAIPLPGSIDPVTRIKHSECFQGKSSLFAKHQWSLLSTRAFAPGNRMFFDEEGMLIVIDSVSPEFMGSVGVMVTDCRVTGEMVD